MCYQAGLAAVLVDRGVQVVLCGPDGSALAAALATERASTTAQLGRGRLAVMVGDPASIEEAALAMARELFGGEPVVVRSSLEGDELVAGVPG